jgi:hypothetical protein
VLIGGAAVLVLVIVAAIAGTESEDDAETVAAEETTTTTVERTTTTAEETTTTTAPTTTTTEAPPAPVELSGSGDSIVDVTLPVPGEPAAARIVGSGSSNFAVWSLDASGAQNELLVNTIGAYEGVVPIDFRRGTTSAFEITSDGPWTITVIPLVSLERTTGSFSGTGDMVFAYLGDSNRAEITYQGESNFAVHLYPAQGRADLLVNEIGAYSGTVRYGAGFVTVTASGPWSIVPA